MSSRLLDLHGVKAEEVVPRVDEFLVNAEKAGYEQVSIMTGKGTGKVKAIVVDYLRNARYPWHYEKTSGGKDNEGVLLIPIK